MNAENNKTHTTVDESLEAFTPYPAYHPVDHDQHNHWYQQFLDWLKFRH